MQEFARTMKITDDESRQAFADSGPLYDFTVKHRDDPRFGAVWATYDGGYKVHLRLLDASFLEYRTALEQELGKPVDVHDGGLSAGEMERFVATARSLKSRANFTVNAPLGTIDLHAGSEPLPVGVVDASSVRVVESPGRATGQTNSAADIWDSSSGTWYKACTAGFMYKGPNIAGYGTAGHCPDGGLSKSWVQGTTGLYSAWSNPLGELCPPGGGDWQMTNFDGGSTLVKSWAFDKRSYPHPSINFRIAGGFYSGQPTLKMGLFDNGANGSNTGTVTGFSNIGWNPSGDCPGGSYTSIEYTNLSAPGDSGGPVFLSYGGGWFLGMTHAGAMNPAAGAPGPRFGQFVNWIPMPSGYWICNLDNPCN